MRKLIGLVAALAALGCFVAAASATAGGTPPASNQGVLPPRANIVKAGASASGSAPTMKEKGQNSVVPLASTHSVVKLSTPPRIAVRKDDLS